MCQFKDASSLQINLQVQLDLSTNPQVGFSHGPWETDSKVNPEKKMDNND